ncbi:MAG: DUF3306 domain-containing protein [Thioalkalivibrio sp.]|nr:DUF3306 domain-containing protein [Thioalkalivibrio sp.]
MKGSEEKEPRDDGQGREEEGFLRRWVKRKAEARSGDPDSVESPVATDPAEVDPVEASESSRALEPRAPAETSRREPAERSDVDMPPLDSLDQDSDYSPFLSRGVSPGLRQTALRQLFRQPKFNVETCLDDFQDDFLNFQPLGDIVTADMRHMAEVEAQREAARAAKAAEEEAPPSEPALIAEEQSGEEDDGAAPGENAVADVVGEADAGAEAGSDASGRADSASPSDDQTRMKS